MSASSKYLCVCGYSPALYAVSRCAIHPNSAQGFAVLREQIRLPSRTRHQGARLAHRHAHFVKDLGEANACLTPSLKHRFSFRKPRIDCFVGGCKWQLEAQIAFLIPDQDEKMPALRFSVSHQLLSDSISVRNGGRI